MRPLTGGVLSNQDDELNRAITGFFSRGASRRSYRTVRVSPDQGPVGGIDCFTPSSPKSNQDDQLCGEKEI